MAKKSTTKRPKPNVTKAGVSKAPYGKGGKIKK